MKFILYITINLVPVLVVALDVVQTTKGGSEVSIFRSNKCREMRVGERLQANYTSQNSPTGIHSYYTLSKTGDKAYSIDLDIIFWAAHDYDGDRGGIKGQGSQIDDHVDGIYRQKMRQCFAAYGDKIKDSRGNSFRFQLPADMRDTQNFTKTADRIFIEVSSQTHRSNSLKYESDIDCPTMIHETLHLLGLCDEYRETSSSLMSAQEAKARGFDPISAASYDCRKIGPEDSVMANHYAALEENYDLEMGFCKCNVKDCGPARVIEASSCPPNMRLEGGQVYPIKLASSAFQIDTQDLVATNVFVLISKKVKLPAKPHPLSDKQADVILYPGCEEVNGEYYKCAADAYRTSTERGGEGCLEHSCRK